MKRLIEISGVSSSGKTTLAKELAKRLSGVFVGEAIRTLEDVDFNKANTDENYAMNLQKRILMKQIKLVTQALKENDIVVCDRSFYDYTVYVKIGIKDEMFNISYNHCADLVYSAIVANHIIYSLEPLDFVDDGFRNTEIREDELKYFSQLKLPNNIKIKGNVFEDRIKQILKLENGK